MCNKQYSKYYTYCIYNYNTLIFIMYTFLSDLSNDE